MWRSFGMGDKQGGRLGASAQHSVNAGSSASFRLRQMQGHSIHPLDNDTEISKDRMEG